MLTDPTNPTPSSNSHIFRIGRSGQICHRGRWSLPRWGARLEVHFSSVIINTGNFVGDRENIIFSPKLPARRLSRCALDTTNKTQMWANSSLELAAHSFGPFTVGPVLSVCRGKDFFLSPRISLTPISDRGGDATRPTTHDARRTRVCAGASHRHCSVENRPIGYYVRRRERGCACRGDETRSSESSVTLLNTLFVQRPTKKDNAWWQRAWRDDHEMMILYYKRKTRAEFSSE